MSRGALNIVGRDPQTGAALSGELAYVYDAETTTEVDVFSTRLAGTAEDQPLTLDAYGRWQGFTEQGAVDVYFPSLALTIPVDVVSAIDAGGRVIGGPASRVTDVTSTTLWTTPGGADNIAELTIPNVEVPLSGLAVCLIDFSRIRNGDITGSAIVELERDGTPLKFWRHAAPIAEGAAEGFPFSAVYVDETTPGEHTYAVTFAAMTAGTAVASCAATSPGQFVVLAG